MLTCCGKKRLTYFHLTEPKSNQTKHQNVHKQHQLKTNLFLRSLNIQLLGHKVRHIVDTKTGQKEFILWGKIDETHLVQLGFIAYV